MPAIIGQEARGKLDVAVQKGGHWSGVRNASWAPLFHGIRFGQAATSLMRAPVNPMITRTGLKRASPASTS